MLAGHFRGRILRRIGAHRRRSHPPPWHDILAGAVLLGIGLNALAGLWWADPLAALVIVYYGLREGIAAIRG